RVGIRGEPLRLGQAERIVAGHVRRLRNLPEESKRPSVPGTKGRAFRGATLIRRCRTCLTDRWRSRRRSALPCIAGALRRSLLGDAVRSGGSRVHSPPPPSRFPPATGSLCRRSTGTRPVHSPYSIGTRSLGTSRWTRQGLDLRHTGRPRSTR